MKKYITEFIGTFFLVIGTIFGGAIGASLALMGMVYAGGHLSGAHYNPAVTFAIWMRGRLEKKYILGYCIFQLLGAAAAGFLASAFFKETGGGSCGIPLEATSAGIIAELVGTFALVFVVLNVATATGTSGNSFYGLAIAGTVLAMATALGKFSGGVFNPAVYAGLFLQKSVCGDQCWMYLAGEFGGAVLAVIVFSFCNPDDK